MSVLFGLLVAIAGMYWFSLWLRADGGSLGDVAKQDFVRIRGAMPTLPPPALPTPKKPTDLFVVKGRHQFDEVAPPPGTTGGPAFGRRKRGGVAVGPPTGRGRVRNPNAPCWNCGQKKTPGHKCF